MKSSANTPNIVAQFHATLLGQHVVCVRTPRLVLSGVETTASNGWQNLTATNNYSNALNTLNSKSDKHQISPCNVNYKTEWS